MPAYIHERDDWPEFRWDEAEVNTRLAPLRHRQGRLAGRMEALGFDLRNEATLQTLTADVLETSEIEGEILDQAQVRSSIARRLGIDIGALTPAERDVEGIVEMTLDATQRFEQPVSRERLFGWHAALFPAGRSGMRRIDVGTWRKDKAGLMQVVSGPPHRERVHFEAPAAKRLPAEMSTFLGWFNAESDTDPVLRAALAHFWLVTIHPFEDGNGRIARAIADMALAQAEGSPRRFYSMSAQIRRERNDYYAVLETEQKGDLDITPWMAWFLGCLDRAIASTEGLLASVLAKGRFWERHAGVPFNDRQRMMLNRLLDGFEGKLTSSKWATLAKVSQDTALRDIEGLMERGILEREAPGGRSTSYALAK